MMIRKLNRFNLVLLSFLLLLIFESLFFVTDALKVQSSELRGQKSEAQEQKRIKLTIEPKLITLGETVSVKVEKLDNEKATPKIFFQKTKHPVFLLSSGWYRTLIPISANFKPGDYELEVFYGKHVERVSLSVKDKQYPLQELTLPKQVAGLKASKTEKNQVASVLSLYTPQKYWKGKFIFPSAGNLSTEYGVKRRVNGYIDPDYFHKGLDFAASQNSLVRAPEDGKIVLAGIESKGFVVNGNCIFIDHGHGVISGYLHLSSLSVKKGELVKKGQLIGRVGSTGIASGPHLHWGLYVLGKTVEPLIWTKRYIE